MGGPPCPHPDGAFFKDGPNHFLEFVQNPIKIRKIRVVPLRSGYPFFALNASIEPRSVHTCLLGLVGVPRAQRAAVAPYCAAWGRKPAILGPKTVVFSPSSGFWPFRDSGVHRRHVDLSHFPSKGARSAWQCRFGRAVAFSGRTRRHAVSAKNLCRFVVARDLLF